MRRGKAAVIACATFALVVGATMWAAEITSVSVTTNALTITQGGEGSFGVSLDSISGNIPPRASAPPSITYCAEWSIHSDGVVACDNTSTVALPRGRNYSKDPVTVADGYAGTVVVNVDADAPCPALYELTETFTSNSGSGLDFGGGLLEVSRTVFVSVACNTAVTPFQGCSHGYWKNHESEWPAPYPGSTTLGSVFNLTGFSSLGSKTLADALKFKGGDTTQDKAENMLKQAAAALLNAAHPGIYYPYTVSELIAEVNSALASKDSALLTTLGETLDVYNNYHGTAVCGDSQ